MSVDGGDESGFQDDLTPELTGPPGKGKTRSSLAALVSLGVLPQAALRRLQGAGEVLLGLGKPLLGPQALEALAAGRLRHQLRRPCGPTVRTGSWVS